jgi:nucleotide-binding universal stress UspA family protein
MTLPQDILVATDFSVAARHALEAAASLSQAFGASLTLFHAHDPAPLGRATPFIPFHMSREDIEREASARVQDELRKLREEVVPDIDGVRIDACIHRSAPAAIGERIEQLDIDLVVLGHRGHGGIQRMLMGGVAERVVRHVPCSVLAVAETQRAGVLKKLLVAVDLSPASLEACATAAAWAAAFGASLTLMQVVPPATMSATVPVAASPLPLGMPLSAENVVGARQTREAARASLEEVRRERCAAIVRVECDVVEHPSVTAAVNERVARDGVGLVVVGSVGHGGFERVLLGSVSEKIVRNATCSVLIVRARQATD